MFNNMIKKSVIKSQHCQRNWDLSKEIPAEDLDTIETAITQCPSKQNIKFYKPYMIQDRNIIEQIHACTDGFIINGKSETNSQTLANLLVVFVQDSSYKGNVRRNVETANLELLESNHRLNRDKLISVGIAAGYCNLTATMLGYSTGCCSCFDSTKIKEILGTKEEILLLMGVGYPDETRNRREHHSHKDFVFPTFDKDLKATRL